MTLNKEILTEMIVEDLKKSDVISMVKNDKDVEKWIKEVASEVITELFRVLWQHNSLFKNLAR